MKLICTGTGVTIKAASKSTILPYELISTPSAIAPTITQEASGDAVLNKNTASGALPGYRFLIDAPVDKFELVNQTPTLLDQVGNVFTAKSGAVGFGDVLTRNHSGVSTTRRFPLNELGAIVTYDIAGFDVNSIGYDGFELIKTRLALGGDLSYYNGASYAACAAQPGGIQRNPACWGKDWDLSGVAVRYLFSNFNGGGCLVTPRHYIASHHYGRGNKVGTLLYFVGTSETVYIRTIIAQTAGHADTSHAAEASNQVYPIGDMVMFLLNSPLPSDVAVYPVAGDWIYKAAFVEDNLNGTADYDCEWTYPIITTNQRREVLFSTCNKIFTGFSVGYPLGTLDIDGVSVAKPTMTIAYLAGPTCYRGDVGKQAFAKVGDSGSTQFLPKADGGLIAFSHYTFPTLGPLYNGPILNTLIQEVDSQVGISTGYTVTVAPDPTL